MRNAANETALAHRGELAEAASHLAPLVWTAQAELDGGGYWGGYARDTAWHDGVVNGLGGASGDLAGAISPDAVTEILRLLRAEARCPTDDGISPHLLTFARLINAQERRR